MKKTVELRMEKKVGDTTMKRFEQLPMFCEKCDFQRVSMITGTRYCRQNCKYHPDHRLSAWRSYFHKAAKIGVM